MTYRRSAFLDFSRVSHNRQMLFIAGLAGVTWIKYPLPPGSFLFVNPPARRRLCSRANGEQSSFSTANNGSVVLQDIYMPQNVLGSFNVAGRCRHHTIYHIYARNNCPASGLVHMYRGLCVTYGTVCMPYGTSLVPGPLHFMRKLL